MPEGRVVTRLRVTHPEGGRKMTKQADYDKTDINKIMGRYRQHGVVPVYGKDAFYGNFDNVDDYLTARLKLDEARREFEALPSNIRNHVDNDAGEFLRMMFDPAREDEARELGLLEPKQESAPAPPDPPAPPTEEPTP